MLKLDRLELSGFKSFVDPVELGFAGGMTAIVGPNGCGKSNVSDAVVWVLGERSAKTLRGSKMEDVIFAGSSGRKPLGMAEVTLTLSTDPGFAGDEDQLTITRRLFRSGESQYRMNGKRVRLKDIRDLLMDTGLGIRAYSVIEQGKIGMILSGKPVERRRLLEEAAGITRYRERRRLAELKLEEARANLARLDDIVSEIERSMRSLKRQAGAARRFQERQGLYRELLRKVLVSRWMEVRSRLSGLEGRIAEAVDRDADLTARLHRREATLTSGREELDKLAAELAEQHRKQAELAARIEGKQEFLKGSRQRLGEVAERLRAGQEEETGSTAKIGELARQRQEQRVRRGELEEERRRAASDLTEDQRRISDVEKLVADAENRLESLRRKLLVSFSELTGMRNQLHREQVEDEKGGLRRKHLAEELERKAADIEQARASGEEFSGRLGALDRQLEQQQAERADLQQRLDQALERHSSAIDQRDQLTRRLDDLSRRRDALTELGRSLEERRETVRHNLVEAGLEDPLFLSDRIEVPEGWERSLDLYLGELADSVLLPRGHDAVELARRLAEGVGTTHLIAPAPDAPRRATIEDPAIHSSLGQALGLDPETETALPPAYLVRSRVDARRLARTHTGVSFISREGLWARDGILHLQGREAPPGILGRQHALDDITEAIPGVEERLEGVLSDLARTADEIAKLRGSSTEAERRLAATREEAAADQARQEEQAGRLRRLEIERDTLEAERTEVDREFGLLAERGERLGGDLTRAESLHSRFEASFDQTQKEVDGARADRENSRTSGVSRRGRLELIDQRLAAHDQETSRGEAEIAEIERRQGAWRQEAERLERRQEEISVAMAGAESELRQALEDRDRSHSEVTRRQETLNEKRDELSQLHKGVEGLRGERDELRSALSELRVEEAAVGQEGEHVAEAHRENFEEELTAETRLAEEETGPLAELETDLERCKEQIDRVGPVNLLAAEEFSEQEERHGFLVEQRDDVRSSIESLVTTIREIDATSSERFKKTFDEVNEQFRKTFTDLFRGGAAEMRLMDEEDVLECGLEIVARPPGKRLQNMMLLSGGEKALTAIALLFALFQTKPSPFCILDEVDAPLDDVNTLRFVDLLKRMSKETQFIIITHNKLTMEAASTLYGVTMQEKGVSNLVSVELDQVQPVQPVQPPEPMAATG